MFKLNEVPLSLRSIYVSMEGKAGLSLLAVNQVLDRYDTQRGLFHLTVFATTMVKATRRTQNNRVPPFIR